MMKQAFDKVFNLERSIAITVKNQCALSLTECRWYAHHGTHPDAVCPSIAPEKSFAMKFVKHDFNFFGVSGFIEFTLTKGTTKKILIVAFLVPIRKKTNIVTVTLVDKKERALIGDGSTTYAYLIQTNIDKLKKRKKRKLESAKFQSSTEGGIHTNPCVEDDDIKIRVACAINHCCNAALKVTVTSYS